MRVVINAAYLPPHDSVSFIDLLATFVHIVAAENPDHVFIFVCPSAFDKTKIDGSNIIFHAVKSSSNSLLKVKYGIELSLPRILRKHKTDVLLSCVFPSSRTSVPQYILMHAPGVISNPKDYPKLQSVLYKKSIVGAVEKAAQLLVLSATAKELIINNFPAAEKKIQTVRPVISPAYKAISFDESESIRNKYTTGKSFFLYNANAEATSTAIQLLKSFSLFKKRQQSSMKLVIAFVGTHASATFKKSLSSYKYRDDVVLIEQANENEYALLLAAAWCFVLPALPDGLCLDILRAIRCYTPVITSDVSLTRELLGEDALYANPSEVKSIADQLMRIYKDENLHEGLVAKMATLASKLEPGLAATEMWSFLQQGIRAPA